jgi:2-haloacid dehalogenase
MLDFSRFSHLTFDCYGTLIDWETGILNALRPVLAAHRRPLTDREILEMYAELESLAEQGPYMPYAKVLEEVVNGFGQRLGFTPDVHQECVLEDSLKNWPPFSDTVAALEKLATRYKLCVISNIDDDLFAETEYQLTGGPASDGSIRFAHVITAQQCGSYKPSLNNFATALERIGVGTSKVLHVAQSLHHDAAPARSIGLATVWVNRRKGQEGPGATPATTGVTPDLEVATLQELAETAVG